MHALACRLREPVLVQEEGSRFTGGSARAAGCRAELSPRAFHLLTRTRSTNAHTPPSHSHTCWAAAVGGGAPGQLHACMGRAGNRRDPVCSCCCCCYPRLCCPLLPHHGSASCSPLPERGWMNDDAGFCRLDRALRVCALPLTHARTHADAHGRLHACTHALGVHANPARTHAHQIRAGGSPLTRGGALCACA